MFYTMVELGEFLFNLSYIAVRMIHQYFVNERL